MTTLSPGAARIAADAQLVTRLRVDGLLLGRRTLDALAELRRARDLGRGPARLVDAIRRIEGARLSSPSSSARTSA